MKNYKQIIEGYISQAEETFSGFYGDESADWMSADGAVSHSKAAVTATPYQVIVKNTTTLVKKAVLFGKNKNLFSANYGSDAGIVITTGNSGVSYVELLQQSGEQAFDCGFMRISTSGTSAAAQLLASYNLVTKDANGKSCQEAIITSTFFAPNQFQSAIVDVPTEFTINASTELSFDLLGGAADTIVTISFFPVSKVNASRELSGKAVVVDYKTPFLGYGTPQIGGR